MYASSANISNHCGHLSTIGASILQTLIRYLLNVYDTYTYCEDYANISHNLKA